MTRVYPSEPAGSFESPPIPFEDAAGHTVRIHEYTGGDFDAFLEMYRAFDPTDRAQGIPPTTDDRIQEWLDRILTDDAVNVIASTEDRLVGHATLVPDGTEEYELAIFVLGEFQELGIGTKLITALLGAGQEQGIEQVWLSVERWNTAARTLYRKVGFEPSNTQNFEFEMSLRL
ncbi:GNAT family N-acetyltransferase [Halocatena pleomorpha]|uniref:GNAT family N-acetyltransferase n=1 Tax=Halocatena pleomorpha TaxID=1785090 RepID=A0A3P3RGD8_9EURY|nr:GNAT family N-acetyltransferase [Halocatena pleomorpha]RRJ32512.1 GNAT family N-acetyltransferase [Halocatena pleomorpha]